MICPPSAGLADPTFVLEFDRQVHGVTLEAPNGSLLILQKLTPAERAVALVLADGFSNQEIAEQLGKSIHAVKFLLHKTYEKTGIPNRAALVAILRSHSEARRLRV
jgi:DNA-binding CsgD family transcriptional regulator